MVVATNVRKYDGKGFITGHWVLGSILCFVGVCFGIKAYWRMDGYSSLIPSFVCQFLFGVLFSIGFYGVISATFEDCNVTLNVPDECQTSDTSLKQIS
jgi:hypothetical protein